MEDTVLVFAGFPFRNSAFVRCSLCSIHPFIACRLMLSKLTRCQPPKWMCEGTVGKSEAAKIIYYEQIMRWLRFYFRGIFKTIGTEERKKRNMNFEQFVHALDQLMINVLSMLSLTLHLCTCVLAGFSYCCFSKRNFMFYAVLKICNNLLQSSRVLMNLKGSRLKIPLKRSKNC